MNKEEYERLDKEYYTWAQFDEDCRKITAWAKGCNLKNIFGIPRGGLMVGVRLSHLLNLPIILDVKDITEMTLVVDDISDSGKTLKALQTKIGNLPVTVATLFCKRESTFIPAFFCREKTKWVVFPWETDETSKYDYTTS